MEFFFLYLKYSFDFDRPNKNDLTFSPFYLFILNNSWNWWGIFKVILNVSCEIESPVPIRNSWSLLRTDLDDKNGRDLFTPPPRAWLCIGVMKLKVKASKGLKTDKYLFPWRKLTRCFSGRDSLIFLNFLRSKKSAPPL